MMERSHVSGVGCRLTASSSGSKTALCMFAARGAPAPWYGFQSGTSPSAYARCVTSAHGSTCQAGRPWIEPEVGSSSHRLGWPGNGAKPFVPTVLLAVLSVRPPKRTGEKATTTRRHETSSPTRSSHGHAAETETAREPPARPPAGVKTPRRVTTPRARAEDAGGRAREADSRQSVRRISRAPRQMCSALRVAGDTDHAAPARLAGARRSRRCAGSEQKRNRRHAATHVGGSRKNRTFLPPSKRRALYLTGSRAARIRAARACHELPVEVEAVGDELDAVDALRPEHLVHRERVAQPVPYVTLNMA